MDQPIELVPLVCVQCSTPIPAESDQVAWVCAQCGQGMLLDLEKGLAQLNVHYAAGIPQNTQGRPFWVCDGKVTIQQRETYGSSRKGANEANAFWANHRRFFVPAFAGTLEERLEGATRLLTHPPTVQPGPAVPFEPVLLPLEDVQSAAEFIVVAIEAGRKDRLKTVNFNLELSPPALWILP